MVPRPLARAQAMRSRTCADAIQPCRVDGNRPNHRNKAAYAFKFHRRGVDWA